MRKRITLVVGTRPEAIKLCPLVHRLKNEPMFDAKFVVTGQHREMLHQVLRHFDVKPDVDLALMTHNQGLPELQSRAMEAIGKEIADWRPDAIVLQGDTTTVLAGALASFYQRVPVAHVEAGLRTGDMYSPFPEEMNRVLTSRLAYWHFAPTDVARDNLLKEGIRGDMIEVTGNTVIDALLETRDRLRRKEIAVPELLESFGEQPMLLVTGHRRENFGEGLRQICDALVEIGRQRPDLSIVYPVHLNPNVKGPVHASLGQHPNIHLIEPLDYAAFVAFMDRATLILTDSGGVQEEAPSLDTPVLVMRENSERPEAIKAGAARLVGANKDRIVREVLALLGDTAAYRAMASASNPYGDGRAGLRIVDRLKRDLS